MILIGVFDYGKSFTTSESEISRISRQTRRMVLAKGKKQVRAAKIQSSQPARFSWARCLGVEIDWFASDMDINIGIVAIVATVNFIQRSSDRGWR